MTFTMPFQIKCAIFAPFNVLPLLNQLRFFVFHHLFAIVVYVTVVMPLHGHSIAFAMPLHYLNDTLNDTLNETLNIDSKDIRETLKKFNPESASDSHTLISSNISDRQTRNGEYDIEVTILSLSAVAHANHLHHPCTGGRYEKKPHSSLSDASIPINNQGLELIRQLITKSTFLQGIATNIIRMNLIDDCTTLKLPHIANVPSMDELNNLPLVESLRFLYASLVNQTAHVFFIWDQQRIYINHNCSVHLEQREEYQISRFNQNSKEYSRVLAQHYWSIAVNLRDLLCLYSHVSSVFDIDLRTYESTKKVLYHGITDTSLCSRKAVRDCQIMKSSIALLEVFSEYLREQTLELTKLIVNKS